MAEAKTSSVKSMVLPPLVLALICIWTKTDSMPCW